MPSRDPHDSAHHEESQIQALERPGPAADAWQPPAAPPRLPPPRDHQPVRGAEPGLRPGHLPDDGAAPRSGVQALPCPPRQAVPAGPEVELVCDNSPPPRPRPPPAGCYAILGSECPSPRPTALG